MTPGFARGALRRFALLALALTIAGCSDHAQVYHRKFPAMGTLINVTIYGTDKATAEHAMDQVEQQFHYMAHTWQPWKPGALARVNSLLPTTDWFSVAPSVRPLIVSATKLADESGHRFDPAIGKLLKLWGFDSEPRAALRPPDPAKIAALVAARPRMSDIQLKGILVRSRNPAVALDFGGYAKGYGIDRTIDYLKSQGIHNAIINAGGDLRAIGRRGQRPWRIGIRNPRGPGVMAHADVQGDESVFTSGDYERSFTYKGKRYHHVLDPRTGYPTTGTASVTVICRLGATGDAAATALMVAGPKHWYRVAKAMGIHYVMLMASNGTVYMNPAMAKRIHFETGKPPKVVLSPPL
jgi:thiamine biosynthesis lipoprotein